MDLQKLVDIMNETGRLERAKYHMTLGGLIAALDGIKDDLPAMIDNSPYYPGKAHSYRGFYTDLAFQPSNERCTVGDLRARCCESLNAIFEGYKGGDFTMTEDTPLWISDYGETSDIAVMGVENLGSHVVLITKWVDN